MAADYTELLPMLTLRDYALTPGAALPLFVGRAASQAAIAAAAGFDQRIFTITQRNADEQEPKLAGLHAVGTIARVTKILRLPDGNWKVEFAGLGLAKLLEIDAADGFRCARILAVATASDRARGVPAPQPARGERPDDVIEEGSISGFDPAGDPGYLIERCGTINVIFEEMPPSWFTGTQAEALQCMKALDQGIVASVDGTTLWDNLQTLIIENPQPRTLAKLTAFLLEFRARYDSVK